MNIHQKNLQIRSTEIYVTKSYLGHEIMKFHTK